MENLNLLFNKLYYQEIGTTAFKNFEGQNNALLNATFDHKADYRKSEISNCTTFLFKTVYPGLLLGSGNPHGTGLSDSDINMGFTFDYVTGQPCIPGSSVKGVLRSHFENHPKAIKAILEKEDLDVAALTKEIFGVPRGEGESESDGQDVFLDAVVFDTDSKGHLLGDDYITPHSSPVKNPIPIHFIKVLPGVRFEFRFVLKDGIITAKAKEDLFKELLILFGIGAKTNVGYGVLVSDDSPPRVRVPQEQATPQNGNNRGNNRSNNYGNGNRGNNNYGSNRGNNYGNRAKNTGASGPEKVKCPHCGWDNYKYNKQGVKNKKCYNNNCGKDLP